MFVNGDVVYAQTWEVLTLKNPIESPKSSKKILSSSNGESTTNKNRRKAIFNWAAKGLLFLRGRGGYH